MVEKNGYGMPRMTRHSEIQLDRKTRIIPQELAERERRLIDRELGPIDRSPALPISFTFLKQPENCHIGSFAAFDEIVLTIQADEGYRTNREPQV